MKTRKPPVGMFDILAEIRTGLPGMCVTELIMAATMLLIRILEVLVWILGWETGSPVFRSFPQSSEENARIVPTTAFS
jgi:hypothetical protein